jgi:pyruvate dehydrogenase E2 component (dihydrolipoamide acetyltransferase)
VINAAAAKSLTAIAAARRDANGPQGASSAISMPGIAGVASVAEPLAPPFTTLLGIGAPRRAPVEGAGGAITFADMVTVTLACDARAFDAALGARLLAAFKGFVERPVTMIV